LKQRAWVKKAIRWIGGEAVGNSVDKRKTSNSRCGKDTLQPLRLGINDANVTCDLLLTLAQMNGDP
jgi:hypothetical protein